MKSLSFSRRTVNLVLPIGLALTLLAISGPRSAIAQSITIDFRFDNNAGANPTVAGATTVTLLPGTAGQTYLVDVFATVSGGSTPTMNGLKDVSLRGISDITTAASAFATGAGIGAVGAQFQYLPPFNAGGADANTPATPGVKVSDLGSTNAATAGNTVNSAASATADGILDFGGTVASQVFAPLSFSNATVFGPFNGNGSPSGSNAFSWEIGTFKFTTGVASSTLGSTTLFYPAAAKSSGGGDISTNGSATTTNFPITIGTPLTFKVGAAVGTGTTVNVIPGPNVSVLQGGTATLGASIQNTGSSNLVGGTYTFTAADGSGGTSNVTYGAAAPPTLTTSIPNGNTQAFTFSAGSVPASPIGPQTVTFTASGGGINPTGSNLTGTLTLNVGNATADNNGTGSFAAASTLLAQVAPGGSYANLVSRVTALSGTGGSDARNAANPSFGGTARILAGTNVGGSGTVLEQWRTRTALPANAANGTSEAAGTHPPLPFGVTSPLISDVVNLTGLENPLLPGGVTATDPYTLDMTYNYNLLPKNSGAPVTPPSAIENGLAGNKLIFLASLNPTTGFYDNAVSENITGTNNATLAQRGFLGSFATFQSQFGPVLAGYMGAWGVDTTNHEVWAVLDHNSSFAVVPEPSTLLLAGLGLLGLVGLRRRVKRVA